MEICSILAVSDNNVIGDSSGRELWAGGSSVDVSKIIHEHWVRLAARVADSFNLRILGLDLACPDITNPNASYSVLEVNAAPGLDHYASSGKEQQRIVDDLYARVFNAFPHL